MPLLRIHQLSFGFIKNFQAIKQDPNAFAMQSNVVRESWSSPNVASAYKNDRSEEATIFKSRDLIREYLLKARVPEILKTQSRGHAEAAMMTSEISFAYKHPLVAAEEFSKNGSGETLVNNIGRKCFNDSDDSSSITSQKSGLAKKIANDKHPHLITRNWKLFSDSTESPIYSEAERDFSFDLQASLKDLVEDAGEKFFDSVDNLQYIQSSFESSEMLVENLDSLEMQLNCVTLDR